MRSRRAPKEDPSGQGQDSFLDVIANMVGIMIILVMIVGGRASQFKYDLPEAAIPADEPDDLAPLAREAGSLQTDVQRLDAQSRETQVAVNARALEREKMALLVAAVEDELASQRQSLDANAQLDFDMRRAFAEARTKIDELSSQRAALDAVPAEVVKVQSLPTPISKTVHGKETHFQLRNGRLMHIPLDELLETFQTTARHKAWKLEDQGAMTDVIGPIGGFRMRYELGRFEIPAEVARETGRGGSMIRLVKWELLPVTLDQGETIEEALATGSQLRETIAKIDAARTTITVWTYPDSFDAFRKLKAELHSLGFATASRPLPDDHPIGGSPEGSRSSAQ